MFEPDYSRLEVSVDEVAEAISSESHTLLDVRERDEWDAGHIEEAILIPLGELQVRANEIPADKPIYTICRSGKRSITALQILDATGHPGGKSMAGGMIAWHEAGKPMVN